MKAISILLFCAVLFLQLPNNSFAQTPTEHSLVPNTNVIPTPVPVSASPNSGHLITLTADYEADAISIFYPDRTELIYVKTRKSRWVDNNKYNEVVYDVVYQDGTRKHFENVKLFRNQDVLQRVVTDHLSKLTELGYELVSTNMTDFGKEKYLTAFFRFKG